MCFCIGMPHMEVRCSRLFFPSTILLLETALPAMRLGIKCHIQLLLCWDIFLVFLISSSHILSFWGRQTLPILLRQNSLTTQSHSTSSSSVLELQACATIPYLASQGFYHGRLPNLIRGLSVSIYMLYYIHWECLEPWMHACSAVIRWYQVVHSTQNMVLSRCSWIWFYVFNENFCIYAQYRNCSIVFFLLLWHYPDLVLVYSAFIE